MKRMLSTFVVIAVLALSAVSVASARHWDGDDEIAVQQTTQQNAPAKHHKGTAKKLKQAGYYRGPH
jgi:ABC-type uncharacterized transport system substrate-binding protein